MRKGLQGQHLGLRINGNYYSPAQFADAWIAVTEKSKLVEILNKEVDKIINNNFQSNDTPLLAELVKNKSDDNERFGIDDITLIARKSYDTAKIINNSGLEFSDGTYKFSFSVRDNIFVTIDTRRKRTAKKHAHEVYVHDAIYDNIDEINKFYFEGGTQHSYFSTDELSHWSRRVERENRHLKNIESKFGKSAADKYRTKIKLADSAIAHLLIVVDNELKKKKNNEESLIEFDVKESDKAFLPIDFNMAPELAIENFLQLNLKLKGRNKEKMRDKRYFAADKLLMKNFERFTPHEYLNLRKQGKASFEVYIAGKYFPKDDFSWAVIQAFEEHMHEKNREFAGFTLERIGDYDFVAISFKNTEKSKKQQSIRIIYDDMFFPVAFYKTVTYDGLGEGTTSHPMKLLNFSKKRNTFEMIYRDKDLKSGKTTINGLYEPSQEIRDRAAQILFENGIKRLGDTIFKNEKEMSKYILHQYILRKRDYSNVKN